MDRLRRNHARQQCCQLHMKLRRVAQCASRNQHPAAENTTNNQQEMERGRVNSPAANTRQNRETGEGQGLQPSRNTQQTRDKRQGESKRGGGVCDGLDASQHCQRNSTHPASQTKTMLRRTSSKQTHSNVYSSAENTLVKERDKKTKDGESFATVWMQHSTASNTQRRPPAN